MTFFSTFVLLIVVVIVLTVLFICVPIIVAQHLRQMREDRERWGQ